MTSTSLAGLLLVVLLVGACQGAVPMAAAPATTAPEVVSVPAAPARLATPAPAEAAPPTATGLTGVQPTAPAPPVTPFPPPPTELATADPASLAAQLATAEAAIRHPDTPEPHVAGWAHLQQQAYRALAARAEWHAPVGAALPGELQAAFDANLRARLALDELNRPRDQLPAWRIVPPAPGDELVAAYRDAASEWGIDWTYLAAIHLVETRLGRIEGTSHAGAQGPMQFMPATWAAYGQGSVHDIRAALRAAAYYLVDHGAPGDMPAALWAYNHSDRYVEAIEAYASVIRADEAAFRGYYHWQVYYRHVDGEVLLEEGWAGP